LNPNGYGILKVLRFYRSSYMQSRLLEWTPPALWPPSIPVVLLILGAGVLIWARRSVRVSDWLLFAAFAAATLTAQRNSFLAALIAPIVIVSYLRAWRRPIPLVAHYAAGILLIAGLGTGIARGTSFQLRAAEWKYPAGAADFLLSHHVSAPLFNSYEYGGYLTWRLWPQERVFIDGRALSESLFLDYARILYNHDTTGGKSADELLDQYGVQVIVMNAFEYGNGTLYNLAPALADPKQEKWKLVYSDPQALVFMRHLPDGVQPLPSLQVMDHMEAECGLHLEREPHLPRCARSLAMAFSQVGDLHRARKWLGTYLTLPHSADPEAEAAYQKYIGSGY
jgi:hypothetical protein